MSLIVAGAALAAPPASSPAPKFGVILAPRPKTPSGQLGPVLFICGDSTVHNRGAILGWGDIIGSEFFDTSRIGVENHAMGGRSSRTFVDEGRWDTVKERLRPGDFVLLQFGHNDSKGTMSLDRYSLPGLGPETEDAVNPKTGKSSTIHTFGYYMTHMVEDAKAAGATVIVLSPVPRSKWADGKIVRGEEHTGEWAAQVAQKESAPFVDLNGIIADRYDPIGQPTIKALYFPQDNTHTNPAGAKVNAACVVLGIEQLPDMRLKDYMLPTTAEKAQTTATIPSQAPPAATAPAIR
jgi:lysophospholipase L1-like esterase